MQSLSSLLNILLQYFSRLSVSSLWLSSNWDQTGKWRNVNPDTSLVKLGKITQISPLSITSICFLHVFLSFLCLIRRIQLRLNLVRHHQSSQQSQFGLNWAAAIGSSWRLESGFTVWNFSLVQNYVPATIWAISWSKFGLSCSSSLCLN